MNKRIALAHAVLRTTRAHRVGRADHARHTLALRVLAVAASLGIVTGGCAATVSSGGSEPGDTATPPGAAPPSSAAPAPAATPPPDYRSAPPPQPPQGHSDSFYVQPLINDTQSYQVAGNRLYYLSKGRGLLVFDVTDVDHPSLLGGSSMSGDPQAVYLYAGFVVAVFADWYGTTAQGTPFHGSVVRVLDCMDPTSVQVVGQVPVNGYIQDSRIAGDVLYTVGTDDALAYGAGWQGGVASSRAVVTSIGLNGSPVQKIAEQTIPGDGAVFALASKGMVVSTLSNQTPMSSTLRYVDVSDPGGAISLRGSMTVSGHVGVSTGYCGNSGGWTLDFADGLHAHAVSDEATSGSTLTTVDFSNPDSPGLSSVVSGLLPFSNGQGVVARFDVDPAGGRALLYLAHSSGQGMTSTPLDAYDLSVPASPRQVGRTTFNGDICSLRPSGKQLFTVSSFTVNNSAGLEIQQLDVTDPTAPEQLGETTLQANRDVFPAVDAPGQIAFDASGTLALVPVTVNPPTNSAYLNGLEVLTLGAPTLGPMGRANVADPVRRGLFVQDRAYAFTDEALSVFDVSDPTAPRPTGQLTFAPYVAAVQPIGSAIAELSSDYNASAPPTDVRLLPSARASDAAGWTGARAATVSRTAPETFSNGSLLYVSTSTCGVAACDSVSQQISVVDVSSGAPVTRGSVQIPAVSSKDAYGPYAPTYYGWYTGPDVVQVASTVLAIRLPHPAAPLHVVDLSNPDAPKVTSVPVVSSGTSWWGNLQVFGGTLYVTTLKPVEPACGSQPSAGCLVAYYVVPVDLKDPARPAVGTAVSVPGIPFGASTQDPTTLYLSNYAWDSQQNEVNQLAVCKLAGGRCPLQGSVTQLGGIMGAAFVENDKAYTTLTPYDWANNGQVAIELHEFDLTNPRLPVDRPVQTPPSWGASLLSLSGNAALVTSGWGPGLADVYLLNGTGAPVYQQTVREPLWAPARLTRQGKTLYMAGGDYGVAAIATP